MNVFTNITSDPTFAASVNELVYDARLFWKFWTNTYTYSEACIIAQNSVFGRYPRAVRSFDG